MAKYQVTFSCGHTETVRLFGKTKDRERWIEWAEENKLCQDCWQAAKEERRQQATAAAIEENISYGLPSLTGSEKQIAWAETIRAEMVQYIEQAMESLMKRQATLAEPARAGQLERAESVVRDEGFGSFDDFVDCSKEAADAIMDTTSAHWWIESRNNSVVVMLQDGARVVAKARKDAIPAALDAKVEATVRPESPLTETVAEIRVQEKSVEIVFPEKREAFWEIVKKQLGYTWSGSVWKRALGVTTGTPAERAAEAGNKLLTAGFIIRIFDPAIRQAAIDGRYEQECHRWVSRKGDDNSRFLIRTEPPPSGGAGKEVERIRPKIYPVGGNPMTPSRPLHHLITAGKLYPKAWKQVEEMRSDRGNGLPDWPSWCFLPLGGWYAIVSSDAGVPTLDLHLVADVARLAAVGTWRYSQGIYRFDPELYDSLITTELSGDLPAEVLHRLPEWCIYIETPGREWFGSPLHGFFVHLEHDANDGRSELRFVLDTEDALIGFPLHLGEWSVVEAVTRACNEAAHQAVLRKRPLMRDTAWDTELARMFAPLVSLVLYLCSDRPDLTGPKGNAPERPRPVRTRHGWRLFPADRPTMWSVGETLGRELAQARAQASGSSSAKSPHLRRAHWHGYWTGSGDRKRFSYRWLAPIFVGGKTEETE